MKTIKYILSSILLVSGIYACNDDWDSHYSQEEQVVNKHYGGQQISCRLFAVATGIEYHISIV